MDLIAESADVGHVSVLLHELVEGVCQDMDGFYVDVTGGFGGHSEELLKKISLKASLLILDCDQRAVALLKNKFVLDRRVSVVCAPFFRLKEVLKERGVEQINGLMADLGISSVQLDNPDRGLSFLQEGPLDMRLSDQYERTALDVLKEESTEELENIFRNYGEERHAALLARKIKESIERDVIKSTKDLRELCERVVGRFYRGQKIHPATRLFQALRIAVNDELKQLDILLETIPEILMSGARVGIISFHSLEDRRVKQAFKNYSKEEFRRVTRKAVKPSVQEIELNPRSRSARLRITQKI